MAKGAIGAGQQGGGVIYVIYPPQTRLNTLENSMGTLIPVNKVSNGKGFDINQGLDSLPPAAAIALLQPPLVKTIPAVTAMGTLRRMSFYLRRPHICN